MLLYSVERELMYIRMDVSITCGATASHGCGHLTPSPLILGDRIVCRFFFFRAVSIECVPRPPSIVVIVSVFERGVLDCVRAVLLIFWVFALSSSALRPRCLQDTRLRNLCFSHRVRQSFLLLHLCIAS